MLPLQLHVHDSAGCLSLRLISALFWKASVSVLLQARAIALGWTETENGHGGSEGGAWNQNDHQSDFCTLQDHLLACMTVSPTHCKSSASARSWLCCMLKLSLRFESNQTLHCCDRLNRQRVHGNTCLQI